MQYHEAANFLSDLGRHSLSPGTERTEQLLDALDNPHEEVCCVQIAGTNGKGSTARMLERVLRAGGLDVGLYTSPHLDDLRERVSVNGWRVTEGRVVAFVEAVRDHVTGCAAVGESPTFFETMTAFALWEFARRDVDVAVLEVGLGGRDDATSAVDPAAGAVTSVSLDHTDYLGETVTEIAHDLAHVAPADRPLVTAATGQALAAIRDVADDTVTVGHGRGAVSDGGVSTDLTAAPEISGIGPDVRVAYDGRNGLESEVTLRASDWTIEATLPLLGRHQATNAGVAVALARQVATLDTADIRRGLRNAHWPGRFEIVEQAPLVVLDGAHNPTSCERTAETLASFDCDELHLVTGAMTDKDHRGMAAPFVAADRVTTCEPATPRAEDATVLSHMFAAETAAATDVQSDVATAVERAIEQAGPDDCVLVIGSLYAVAEARKRWTGATGPERIGPVGHAAATLNTNTLKSPADTCEHNG